MRAVAVVCLAVCSLAWGVTPRHFDFKGVVLGEPATIEDVQQKFAGAKCGEGLGDVTICMAQTSVANAYSNMSLAIGRDGIVQRIWLPFRSDSFSDVEAALSEKFGKPTKNTSTVVQNRMGASFRNVIHYWSAGDKAGAQIMLMQYTDLDSSLLYFSTAADRKLMKGFQKQAAHDL